MAGKHTFEVKKGNTFNDYVVWKPGGVVANLTGYSARMHIRKNVNDATALFTMTDANSKIVIDALNGKLTFLLTAAETDAVTQENYKYDLEIESGAGVVTTILEGDFIFTDEATQ